MRNIDKLRNMGWPMVLLGVGLLYFGIRRISEGDFSGGTYFNMILGVISITHGFNAPGMR